MQTKNEEKRDQKGKVMIFKFRHTNINVRNLEASIEFYQKALNLTVSREKTADDGSFKLVYLTDPDGAYEVELTWLRDHADRAYDLGENEWHICFGVDDYEAAYSHHKAMDCIIFENTKMGLYFIVDPDGYWIEITPKRD
jgi:lactoylglutathione lyase